MITADQKRMNMMYKLIDNGWYVVDIVNVETVAWCNANLGTGYLAATTPDIKDANGRWLFARIRIQDSWQCFCAFKNAEDLMWYRMNFDCTVVDKSTHVV